MKRFFISAFIFALSIIFVGSPMAEEAKFKLFSSQIKARTPISMEQVYNGFGCSGKNVSPELNWKNAPKGTKSFAVTVFDRDAPTGGSGWWHWVVFNIPADVNKLQLDAGNIDGSKLPKGAIQSTNDFAFQGYGGPCPPIGAKPHRYVFSVYALNVEKLDLDAKSMPALVSYMIQSTKLKQSKITSKLGRPAPKKIDSTSKKTNSTSK